ncbi:hypothetical protein U1Q18_025100 [Sarracenia purpurea var. burkii]
MKTHHRSRQEAFQHSHPRLLRRLRRNRKLDLRGSSSDYSLQSCQTLTSEEDEETTPEETETEGDNGGGAEMVPAVH